MTIASFCRGQGLQSVLRQSAFLLAIIILSASVVDTGVHAQTCYPSLGDVSNDFPQYAAPSQVITITTRVTVNCMVSGYAVTVYVMPTGTAKILSFATGTLTVNKVTTPATFGPWSLNVYVALIQLSMGRTAYSNRTIIIQIVSGTTTQALTSVQHVSTTVTAALTSTVAGEPNMITQFETQTESVLVVQEEQGYGLLAAIFAAGFVIVTMMLVRRRRKERNV